MGKPLHKALNTEHERQQLIVKFNADSPDWAEQAKPGSFSCHELLDRTAMVGNGNAFIRQGGRACGYVKNGIF